ncbi:MAG TPA: DUF58 domain-containing protein [Thermoleophilaceae bacterium]|nr:DUF58 domain-containing protein [Thermoleophilaceae bacterium]
MGRPIATALLGIGLCVVGAAFDSASLYLPGVAIVLLALVAATWVWLAAIGARVVRAPGPPTVVEDEPFRVQVEAQLGWLPAPGGELADPLLKQETPLAGRRQAHIDALATLPQRGLVRLPPSELTVRDPLRLSSRRVASDEQAELLVLPRVEPVAAAADGGASGAGGLPGIGSGPRPGASLRDDAADGLDLDGLRPYREGAPASRIHWATLARRGEMMERRFVSETAAAPLIVLDAGAPADEAALDAAVRAAASLCVALAGGGGVTLLLPGDRRPIEIDHNLGAWNGVHKRLALVEPGATPSLGGLGPRSGALLWVTGAEAASLPRELEQLAARPRYLVAPTLPPGAIAAFAVADCSGTIVDHGHRSAVA